MNSRCGRLVCALQLRVAGEVVLAVDQRRDRARGSRVRRAGAKPVAPSSRCRRRASGVRSACGIATTLASRLSPLRLDAAALRRRRLAARPSGPRRPCSRLDSPPGTRTIVRAARCTPASAAGAHRPRRASSAAAPAWSGATSRSASVDDSAVFPHFVALGGRGRQFAVEVLVDAGDHLGGEVAVLGERLGVGKRLGSGG